MGYTPADLEQAQRHVSHGERLVQHQQSIVDDGGVDDAERRAAEGWLVFFKTGLAKHVAERDKIASELATRFP
ncbi:hypothetical protein [Hansschlegelia zhihuaiae]|uniref:hypothetical protein n=1 Tax=Hansschlegelia zhihuaiae TaxID=405005 RepID=UPI0013E8AF4A|nr:hypothetical protein [Hansschlegelia zhihuaiae]